MKELLSLGREVDLEKNKTDKSSQINSLILLDRKLENLLCRRLTEVLSIQIVHQTPNKNFLDLENEWSSVKEVAKSVRFN